MISKNLDEENNRNMNDDDDDLNENEKTCLHRNEGIAGAVGYLRLIYYASIMGGRLDPFEQISKERALEAEEMRNFEHSLAQEENSWLLENINISAYLYDPLEQELGLFLFLCI